MLDIINSKISVPRFPHSLFRYPSHVVASKWKSYPMRTIDVIVSAKDVCYSP